MWPEISSGTTTPVTSMGGSAADQIGEDMNAPSGDLLRLYIADHTCRGLRGPVAEDEGGPISRDSC